MTATTKVTVVNPTNEAIKRKQALVLKLQTEIKTLRAERSAVWTAKVTANAEAKKVREAKKAERETTKATKDAEKAKKAAERATVAAERVKKLEEKLAKLKQATTPVTKAKLKAAGAAVGVPR
jgi:predicted  nucleic acid-binding Zn-ribbon protein